jgi:hypothetical protein
MSAFRSGGSSIGPLPAPFDPTGPFARDKFVRAGRYKFVPLRSEAWAPRLNFNARLPAICHGTRNRGQRHDKDRTEGRLVTVHAFSTSWDSGEKHPRYRNDHVWPGTERVKAPRLLTILSWGKAK